MMMIPVAAVGRHMSAPVIIEPAIRDDPGDDDDGGGCGCVGCGCGRSKGKAVGGCVCYRLRFWPVSAQVAKHETHGRGKSILFAASQKVSWLCFEVCKFSSTETKPKSRKTSNTSTVCACRNVLSARIVLPVWLPPTPPADLSRRD